MLIPNKYTTIPVYFIYLLYETKNRHPELPDHALHVWGIVWAVEIRYPNFSSLPDREVFF